MSIYWINFLDRVFQFLVARHRGCVAQSCRCDKRWIKINWHLVCRLLMMAMACTYVPRKRKYWRHSAFNSFIKLSFKFEKIVAPKLRTTQPPPQFIAISKASQMLAAWELLSLAGAYPRQRNASLRKTRCGLCTVHSGEFRSLRVVGMHPCLSSFLASLFACHNPVVFELYKLKWRNAAEAKQSAAFETNLPSPMVPCNFLFWAAPNLIFTYNFLEALNAAQQRHRKKWINGILRLRAALRIASAFGTGWA